MKYFFDTEFIERPCTIDLISIGIVAENGDEFYAESTGVNWREASDWVLDNVKPHLIGNEGYQPGRASEDNITLYRGPKNIIGQQIYNWISERTRWPGGKLCEENAYNPKEVVQDDHPEFWAYYADYDWVAFCWLFGTMLELPEGWPMFCMDLKQWNVQLGERELPKQTSTEHNALHDARWLRDAWVWMDEYLASGDW